MATRDYTLGKGKVLFKPQGSDAYIDLGNAPAFTISLSVDKLEHLSSRSGLSVKDLEVITRLGVAGSFTLDEPNSNNLAMFVMSTGAADTAQVAAALASIDNIVLPAADSLGKWYPLNKTTSGALGSPTVAADPMNIGTAAVTATNDTYAQTSTYSWNIRVSLEGTEGVAEVQTKRADENTWCTAFTVTTTGNPIKTAGGTDILANFAIDDVDLLKKGDEFTVTIPYNATATGRVYNIDATEVLTDSVTVTVGATPMVEGIEGVGNYQVDRKAGLLYINLDQTTPTNAIADGDTLLVQVKTLDATKTTSLGATKTSIKGDLYFVGDPPQGRIIDIMGFCSLTPNGDFSLIGTDWMQMQFNVEFLQVAGVTGLLKVEDRGKVDL